MDIRTLRAYWAYRQGLGARELPSDAAGIVHKTGWVRSVGGANPYLSTWVRSGGQVSVAEINEAVEEGKIYELPSARGCSYVLPAEHARLGLSLGLRSSRAELRPLARLGVDEREIDGLYRAVDEILTHASTPLSPKDLRGELGDRLRSLGDEGKRKGFATPLPCVLGLLQADGRIRRVPMDGRLDSQHYAYTSWIDSPMAAGALSPPDAVRELGRAYWAWVGVASVAHFRWFTALPAREVADPLGELGLVPVALGSDLLMRPELVEEFASFERSPVPEVSFVGWLDGLVLLRRDLESLLDGSAATIDLLGGELGGLSDMPTQAIVDRGEIIGVWEYDPEVGEVVWALLGKRPTSVRSEVEAAAERLGRFAREQLGGDLRGMSLDTPRSRQPRLAAIRALR